MEESSFLLFATMRSKIGPIEKIRENGLKLYRRVYPAQGKPRGGISLISSIYSPIQQHSKILKLSYALKVIQIYRMIGF